MGGGDVPEGRRLIKLNCDTTLSAAYAVNPADAAGASESFHIWAVVGAKTWDTEASGQLLTRVRAVFAGAAAKSHPTAGNVNHNTMGGCFVRVFGE